MIPQWNLLKDVTEKEEGNPETTNNAPLREVFPDGVITDETLESRKFVAGAVLRKVGLAGKDGHWKITEILEKQVKLAKVEGDAVEAVPKGELITKWTLVEPEKEEVPTTIKCSCS